MKSWRVEHVLATCLLVAAGFLMHVGPVHSVHDTAVFELDGNVADLPAGGVTDWSVVNFGPVSGNQLAKTGVTADPAPQSIFTGGGSKDDLDLNGPLSGAGGWKWKSGSVPDKDDITNAYAIAYNVNGDLVIYAGADRFDNSGDAFMGFWFFQNQVGLGAAGGGGGSPFTGQHAIGDVLVLANFSNGGTTVKIEVLKWVGSGGNVNGTLQRIAGISGGTPAKCTGALTNDLFCGITNEVAGETPPWPYTSKSGTSSFPVATFFEVGINISKVFQAAGAGATPCFSSFMAETRASSSVDATLKDFALHSFPVCGIAVSKQCVNPTLSGSQINYTIRGQVQNTGFGTLTNVQLSDNPPAGAFSYYACSSGLPDLTAPVAFSGTLNPLAAVCYQSNFLSSTNAPTDTVTATGSTGSSTVSATATATCQNLQLSPALDVTKTCTTTLAGVSPYLVVKVLVEGTVKNIGDAPLSNVVVTDTDIAGNLLGPTTLAINETKSFSAFYYPSTAENRLSPNSSTLVPGLAKFSDTVTATATAPFSQVTPDTATAHCTLCPTCTPDVCADGTCPTSDGATSSTLFRAR